MLQKDMFEQNLFNQEIRLGVSDFNDLINQTLSGIGEVVIEGEISAYSTSKSGGVFITVKDTEKNAQVQLSGYKPRIEGIDFVEEGMKVAVWGRPEIYSPYGKFSVSIYKILPLGAGALAKAFEELKLKLQTEGLFDEDRKRELPPFVKNIALITAKDSAAYSDFVKILKESNVGINIDFYPVSVQGKNSITEIVNTLKHINKKSGYDCVVLMRGGGSLEDLSAFNDEKMARAVFASKYVSLVAVGHEKDESIAEFAADIRASTPSQAAYYLVANRTNFISSLELTTEHIATTVQNIYHLYQQRINLSSPYSNIMYRISTVENDLLKGNYNFSQLISERITYYKDLTFDLKDKFGEISDRVEKTRLKINHQEDLLQSLDPSNVIKRGYAIIENDDGKILTSISQTKIDDDLTLKLKDGKLITNINKILKNKNGKNVTKKT